MDPAMLDEVRNIAASALAPAPLSTKPYLCDALLGARRPPPAANQPPRHPADTPRFRRGRPFTRRAFSR